MDKAKPQISVDLNSDLGEGYGRWKVGDDDAILKIVSSANYSGPRKLDNVLR